MRKWLKGRDRSQTEHERESTPIESEVSRIQSGDDALRNDLLTRYQPYVAKTASRYCKRYINPERDDEFSVALSAFNEAVDAYNPDAGRSFLGFAETVIRRRLTDYVRKERRFSQQTPQSAFAAEGEDGETFDPIDAAVFSVTGANARFVAVAGRPLLRDGALIDQRAGLDTRVEGLARALADWLGADGELQSTP